MRHAALGAARLERQRAAKRDGVESRDQHIADGAHRRQDAVALLGDIAGGNDAERVGDAHHRVVQRQHRLAALGGRKIEQQRARDRHVDRAGHAERQAPQEQRSRTAHQQEARQDQRRRERRAEEQRAPPDAVGERAEERREHAARHALGEERGADGGHFDARAVHEVDAEELHQAHARRDGEKVRRHHDADARVER